MKYFNKFIAILQKTQKNDNFFITKNIDFCAIYREKLANGAKQRREARQAKLAFGRFCLKTALKIEIASKQFCCPIARILDILNLHLSYLIIKIRCVFIKIRPFEIDPSKSDQVKVGLRHFDFLSHFKVFGKSIGIHAN